MLCGSAGPFCTTDKATKEKHLRRSPTSYLGKQDYKPV